MKKQLLFVCTMALGFGMNAQTNKLLLKEARAIKPQDDANSFVNQAATQSSAHNKTSAIVTSVEAGNSANAYGSTFARRAPLAAMPALNLVTLTHRANAANTPGASSGHFVHGYSSNNGAAWTKNVGPNYSPVTVSGAPAPARYPSGVIFNPSGNTSATGAYVYYAGPALVGGVFAGMVYGSHQVGSTTGNSGAFGQDVANGVFAGFPYGMAVNAAGEALFPVVVNNDMNSTTAAYPNPSAIKLYKLTGATTATTSISNINLPALQVANDAMCRIAFAPNGTTGYVTFQGDDSVTAALPGNDRLRIYITKTTDGGTTWSAWNKIDLETISGLDSLENFDNVLPLDSTAVSTDFQHDLTVDVNGNPHIVTGISKVNRFTTTSYSVTTQPAVRAQFVISSTDGGVTFSAKFLQRLFFLRSTIGAVGTDNNHTASRNDAGTLMTFGCLNVDGSNGFDTSAAPAANFYLTSFSTTNGWSSTVNIIDGSALEGQIDAGQGANFTLNNGQYPLMYTEFGLDANGAKSDVAPAILQYVTGATIPTALTKYKSNLEIVRLFPNPSNGNLFLKVGSAAKNVNLEIINLVGQSVYSSKMAIGTNKVDLTSFTKGVYFANINVDGVKSTQKLIIE